MFIVDSHLDLAMNVDPDADTAAPERRVRMPGQMPRGGREFQHWGGGFSGGFTGGGGMEMMPGGAGKFQRRM